MSFFQNWVWFHTVVSFKLKLIQANQSSSWVFISLGITGSTEVCSSAGQLFKARQLLFVIRNEVFERVLG